MTQQEYNKLSNEHDSLNGNINRMFVTDDYVEVIPEIIQEIIHKGYYECKIKIKLIYFGEYDMDFEYEILESKETDYWEELK